jgi:hypothetical protein
VREAELAAVRVAAAPVVAVAEVATVAPPVAAAEAVAAAPDVAVAEAVGLAAPAFFLSRDHLAAFSLSRDHLAALALPRTRHRAARHALIQSLEPRRSFRPEAALLRSP